MNYLVLSDTVMTPKIEFDPGSSFKIPGKAWELGQLTKRARAMKLLRAKETREQKERRLQAARERVRASRASETWEQRERRLQAARERARASRASETWEQRERRLHIARERARAIRAAETKEQRERRLQLIRERVRALRELRAAEMKDQREAHLQIARERARATRANETAEQREKRLQLARERARALRASETKEQRERRLQMMRDRKRAARASESEDHPEGQFQPTLIRHPLHPFRMDLDHARLHEAAIVNSVVHNPIHQVAVDREMYFQAKQNINIDYTKIKQELIIKDEPIEPVLINYKAIIDHNINNDGRMIAEQGGRGGGVDEGVDVSARTVQEKIVDVVIKEEMVPAAVQGNEDDSLDIEIEEMEVKVEPMLYFSND